MGTVLLLPNMALLEYLNKGTLSALKDNLRNCSIENKAKIIQWNIAKNLNCIQSSRPPFNLVFIDPPYNKHMIEPSLLNLHNSGCMKSGACLTVEHSALERIPETDLPFKVVDQRRYGKTLVSFLDYMV